MGYQRCYPLTRDHSRAVDAFSSAGQTDVCSLPENPRLSWCQLQGILGLRPANERRRYFVTTSLIDWAQSWNQCCICIVAVGTVGRVTHICVCKLTIIGSDNGLSPGRRQAIIWTNAGILLIGPLGTNFSEILIEIQTFSFRKMHLKMLSAKWRPFCLGLNVLTSAGEDSEDRVDIVTTFDFQSSTVRRPWADSI